MDAASVAETLRQKGQAMVLNQKIAGGYDPVAGVSLGGFDSTTTVYGISAKFSWADLAKPNSMVVKGDKKIIVAAGRAVPANGDRITVMGVDWVIVEAEDVSPQGEVLFFYCHLRK